MWKRWKGTEASNKPQEPQHFCKDRTFQNGGSAYPSRPHPSTELDDKNGSEGCLPSSSNPQGRPALSTVSMEWENISFPVPSIRVNLSTAGFLKGDEACSGNPEAHGHSTDYISGRYVAITSSERGVDPNHNTNLPNARSTGSGDQPEKVSVNPPTENGILGIPSGSNNIALDISSREAEKNTTISTTPFLPTECFSERPSEICWQDLSLAESNMASPSSLQGNTVFDKFCDANESVPTGWSRDKVQCHTKTHYGGREQLDLVKL